MNRLTFSWDKSKEKQNIAKHQVSFEEARTAFYDELAIEFYDPDHSTKEDQFILFANKENHDR